MKPYQIFSLLVVLIPTFVGRGYCQSSEAIGSSESCVIVDVQIKGGNRTFVVDGKHLQDTPLLEYLGKHRREHPDNTCASIFVPREVTLGDIGKIQATVSKAQYSPIHVYCCSIGAYQVNEIIFSAPMPVESAKDGKPSVLLNQPDILVSSLYEQVVARHPIGIPYGADKRIFAPYLSKSLLHKIDLATACSRDWVRQNQGRILKAPFGWSESGLFSGANERTDPLTFQIERTELEKDGSFFVYVRLGGGAPPDKPWTWEVAVRVVKENEHHLVDDVVYLKDKEQDFEYRLSESLMYGCDGPRWVGSSNQPR